MNPVGLSDSIYLAFGTSSVTTGAATNADSTPTVTVLEDGTALGYAPTVTNITTGLYKVQIDCTAANGFEAGRRYMVYATATVGAITGRDGIGEFEVMAVDLNTGIDVATSTRLAPTIAARTLDVTATGAAGIDWANVENPASINAMPNTDVGAAFSVGFVEAGGITAATFAAGAIDAAAIATNAIDADALAADAVVEIANGVLRTALTEGYAADGVAPTLEQFLYMVHSELAEFSISGTTITCKKLDGSTTSMTFTLDDAVNPVSRTRNT